MRVALLTREYPPEVYGGAGVHVDHLARVLRAHVELTVHCFGRSRADALGHRPWDALAGERNYLTALRALSIDLLMAAACEDADLVHSHTWCAQLGGHLAKLVHGVPHVTTVHSLEPLRPWKEDQLGGGYHVSEWIERTALEGADAIVAVSRRRAAGRARAGRLDPGHPSARRPRAAPDARARVRLPVDLRAARDRQPRGDGVRDASTS